MEQRWVSIWFRYLTTDWCCRRNPALKTIPFVLAAPDHGRMLVTAANQLATEKGIFSGMVVADARAIFPGLQVLETQEGLPAKLLKGLAEWCIRFAPEVAIDLPGGLILHTTGCAHLWGGEEAYLTAMGNRIKALGYDIRISAAGSIGAAWAAARFTNQPIIIPGKEYETLQSLPPEALRLDEETAQKLAKLGLGTVGSFMGMQRSALRRRFGPQLLSRMDEALGTKTEPLQAVVPAAPFVERLPCLEPIVTAAGIEIALQQLLDCLCTRLQKEGKGLRTAVLTMYKTDNKMQQVTIGTSRASCNKIHLFKLFETKIETIEPALGIELFIMEAKKVEDVSPLQSELWKGGGNLTDTAIAELLDRIGVKTGSGHIHRYLPAEHYWPERSFKETVSLDEKAATEWKHAMRPLKVFIEPQAIEVTAPIPDYPPMTFRHKGVLHKIIKADGPERIEQEWWLKQGRHRDYYTVEDEAGGRYWLFRLGHYDAERTYQWFIHGLFA